MEISLPPRAGGGPAGAVDDIMGKIRAAARHGAAGGITVHDMAEQAGALWVVTQPGEGKFLDAEIAGSGPLLPVTERPVTEFPVGVPRDAVPPVAAPGGTAGLAAAMRANSGLTVGLTTGIVMILALVLVVLLFPSHHQPASPSGRSTVSPASTP